MSDLGGEVENSFPKKVAFRQVVFGLVLALSTGSCI